MVVPCVAFAMHFGAIADSTQSIFYDTDYGQPEIPAQIDNVGPWRRCVASGRWRLHSWLNRLLLPDTVGAGCDSYS